MKPLILSLDYPPNDGGISRLSAGLVNALAAQGYSLRVVTFAAGGRAGIVRPGAPCIEVDRMPGRRDWQIIRAVRVYLNAQGREAPVLATLWNPEATLALLAGARRLSILAHGNEVMAYSNWGLKGLLRRWILSRARAVICNSHFTEGLVRRIAPKACTVVVNPAVDAAAFKPTMNQTEARAALELPQDVRVILTVARLDPIKGHETVLRALAMLVPEMLAGLFYVIAGKGEMRGPLEEIATALGIAGRVRFAGFVNDADLPQWYAAADLFVLPSIVDPKRRAMEGFGMAFTEAQAAGLPVIGTRSGGIPDAVKEGEGGWLIEKNDAESLSCHLERLHADPVAFREQGRLGATRTEREMSWSVYADRILDVI